MAAKVRDETETFKSGLETRLENRTDLKYYNITRDTAKMSTGDCTLNVLISTFFSAPFFLVTHIQLLFFTSYLVLCCVELAHGE